MGLEENHFLQNLKKQVQLYEDKIKILEEELHLTRDIISQVQKIISIEAKLGDLGTKKQKVNSQIKLDKNFPYDGTDKKKILFLLKDKSPLNFKELIDTVHSYHPDRSIAAIKKSIEKGLRELKLDGTIQAKSNGTKKHLVYSI